MMRRLRFCDRRGARFMVDLQYQRDRASFILVALSPDGRYSRSLRCPDRC